MRTQSRQRGWGGAAPTLSMGPVAPRAWLGAGASSTEGLLEPRGGPRLLDGTWVGPGHLFLLCCCGKQGMRKGFSLPLAWQGREHPGKGPSPALVHRKLLPAAPRRQKSPGRQLEASSTSPAECCSAPAGPVPRCPNRATFPREGLWDTVAVPEHQPLPGAWHKTLRDKEPRLLVLQNPLIPH